MTTLETVTLATAIAGAACGVLGAVLGIINTCTQLSKNKIRLRVVPKIAFVMNLRGDVITADRHTDTVGALLKAGNPIRLCVEIVNLSAFSVTVHDVGFGRGDERRHSIVKPELSPPSKVWPARLEPRESVTAYAGAGELSLDTSIAKDAVAFAVTDCGTVARGSSPFFKDYVKQMREREQAGGKG